MIFKTLTLYIGLKNHVKFIINKSGGKIAT